MTLSKPVVPEPPAHCIEIPPDLYRQLELILESSRFGSVEDFTLHVLRDLASHPGRADLQSSGGNAAASHEEEPLTREEIEIIQERLQNLGYL